MTKSTPALGAAIGPALIATALITLARVVYLVWLSPYELVADEAQYWDWSRRPEMSYYSKGPGVAWLIALSTSLFGVAEWTVRLPATLAFAVTSVAVAGLAIGFSTDVPSARRAALIAVMLVNLLPAYQLAAILMTIDAPYIACWAIGVWAAWRAFEQERDGRSSWRPWLACGAAIGAGFLFKYTILLLVPGLLLFALLERRASSRVAFSRVGVAAAVAGVVMLPVLVWNVQHDGAGLRHLLGYLAMPGGDRPSRALLAYEPTWTASFLGAQLAIVGPAIGVIVLAMRGAPTLRADAVRFAVCSAVPILLFFSIATVRAPAEANWPIAGYVAVLALAGCVLAASHQALLERASASRDAVRVNGWWRATVVYGAVALVAIHAPLVTASLPGVGRYVPTLRFRGFADIARQLAPPIQDFRTHTQEPVTLIAASHNVAGLFAFYLPGRPSVSSAGRFLGDRPSAYDYFTDTSLTGDAKRGKPAVFIGGRSETWSAAFVVNDLRLLSPYGPQYATTAFGGPRPR